MSVKDFHLHSIPKLMVKQMSSIKSIEDYLRHVGAENQNDWDQLLVFAELNSDHSSTGYSPFRLNYAYGAALPTSFSVF
jgi:hypothetical protein